MIFIGSRRQYIEKLHNKLTVNEPLNMHNIIEQFEQHFKIVPALSDNLVSRCQELRYQIFCREQHIFDEQIFRESRELDEYDNRSVHALLQYKETGEFAATVRIILPDPPNIQANYPLEEHVSDFSPHDHNIFENIPRRHLAEISRFSVSKNFRRRVGEKNKIHGISKQFGKNHDNDQPRRFDEHITLGLFKAIVNMSKEHKINYWLAFMEPGLIRLLRRVGIIFHRVGPIINYCGMRHACYADAGIVLNGVEITRPDIWEFITERSIVDASNSKALCL